MNNINGVVESEMNRFEKVVSAMETHLVASIDSLKKEHEDFRIDNSKWRVDYEDMHGKKFQEVHEAIRELHQQIGKGQNDWRERVDLAGAELKVLEKAMQGQIADVRHQIMESEKLSEERNVVFTGRLQEKVKG